MTHPAKHRSQRHWIYAAEERQLRQVYRDSGDLSHKHALEPCKGTTDATGVLQDWRHTKIGRKSPLSVTIRHSAMAVSQLEPESREGGLQNR